MPIGDAPVGRTPTRDRVDIRPAAELLRHHVDQFGIEATCSQFDLCRRKLGAIITLRTTRGQHAHFLDRACVEDIVTQGPDTFDALYVPLHCILREEISKLIESEGPNEAARILQVDLPRAPRFVQQLAAGRAGNGARVTHVVRPIACLLGIDPNELECNEVDRVWCPNCQDRVLVSEDRVCPWCDSEVIELGQARTGIAVRVPVGC